MESHIIAVNLLDVTGINVERFLCNDVTQHSHTLKVPPPSPPHYMRVEVGVDEMRPRTSTLSRPLQRSAVIARKDGTTSQVDGKQRFLATWDRDCNIPSLVFETDLLTKSNDETMKIRATISNSKLVQLTIFLTDELTSRIAIARASLTISTDNLSSEIQSLTLSPLHSDTFLSNDDVTVNEGSGKNKQVYTIDPCSRLRVQVAMHKKLDHGQVPWGCDTVFHIRRLIPEPEFAIEVIKNDDKSKDHGVPAPAILSVSSLYDFEHEETKEELFYVPESNYECRREAFEVQVDEIFMSKHKNETEKFLAKVIRTMSPQLHSPLRPPKPTIARNVKKSMHKSETPISPVQVPVDNEDSLFVPPPLHIPKKDKDALDKAISLLTNPAPDAKTAFERQQTLIPIWTERWESDPDESTKQTFITDDGSWTYYSGTTINTGPKPNSLEFTEKVLAMLPRWTVDLSKVVDVNSLENLTPCVNRADFDDAMNDSVTMYWDNATNSLTYDTYSMDDSFIDTHTSVSTDDWSWNNQKTITIRSLSRARQSSRLETEWTLPDDNTMNKQELITADEDSIEVESTSNVLNTIMLNLSPSITQIKSHSDENDRIIDSSVQLRRPRSVFNPQELAPTFVSESKSESHLHANASSPLSTEREPRKTNISIQTFFENKHKMHDDGSLVDVSHQPEIFVILDDGASVGDLTINTLENLLERYREEKLSSPIAAASKHEEAHKRNQSTIMSIFSCVGPNALCTAISNPVSEVETTVSAAEFDLEYNNEGFHTSHTEPELRAAVEAAWAKRIAETKRERPAMR